MSPAKVCSGANLWSCVLIKGLVYDFFFFFFLQLLVGCLTHTQAVLSGLVLVGLPVPAWFSPPVSHYSPKTHVRLSGDSELNLPI